MHRASSNAKNECALFACSETAGKLHLTVVQTRADGWTWARSVTHASSLLHYAAYNQLLATYFISYKLLLALLQRILALGAGKHGQRPQNTREGFYLDTKRIFAFTEHAALLRNQETTLKTNSLEYREPNFEEEKTS